MDQKDLIYRCHIDLLPDRDTLLTGKHVILERERERESSWQIFYLQLLIQYLKIDIEILRPHLSI